MTGGDTKTAVAAPVLHAPNLCFSVRVETIISDHLAPAYRQLLDEVRAVADALEGYSTNAHTLLTAPAKVRNAYLKLPELVARNKSIREARRLINVVGHRQAQHDASGLFGLFAKPMALRPGWKPPGASRNWTCPPTRASSCSGWSAEGRSR